MWLEGRTETGTIVSIDRDPYVHADAVVMVDGLRAVLTGRVQRLRDGGTTLIPTEAGLIVFPSPLRKGMVPTIAGEWLMTEAELIRLPDTERVIASLERARDHLSAGALVPAALALAHALTLLKLPPVGDAERRDPAPVLPLLGEWEYAGDRWKVVGISAVYLNEDKLAEHIEVELCSEGGTRIPLKLAKLMEKGRRVDGA